MKGFIPLSLSGAANVLLLEEVKSGRSGFPSSHHQRIRDVLEHAKLGEKLGGHFAT